MTEQPSLTKHSSSSLVRLILFSRWPGKVFLLFCSFLATLLGLAAPFFQKLFVDDLTGHTQTGALDHPLIHSLATAGPIALVFLAFLTFLLSAALTQFTNYLGQKEAIYMQKVLAQKVYAKTLSLKSQDLRERAVGEIVSLYATDVPGATILLEQTLPTGSSTFFPLIMAPLFLGVLFKSSLFLTLTLMATVAILNTSLAFRQSKFFFRFKQLAAERIGLVAEWIQNIRGLRQLGWTRTFEERIFEKRRVETSNRIKMVTNGQVMNAIASSFTFVFNSVALISFALLSKITLSPGEILTLLWVLAIFLTRPFRQMPWFFTFAFDGWTSIRRLEAFLSITPAHTYVESNKAPLTDAVLTVQGLDLVYGATKVLDSVDVAVRAGELIGITGEVGSGKSLFFLSLLKETGARFKSYTIAGRDVSEIPATKVRDLITYVPQDAFIMNGSIRENLDLAYETETADAVHMRALELASFKLNQEKIVHGLDEIIGERGVNLSGGQKQRLTLARASLKKSPIILIDDGLSQLDIHTEDLVFRNLIEGEWKGCARLIISHRMSLLKRMDRLLFFENGRLAAQGSLDHLLASCPQFVEYISKEEAHGSKDQTH